MTFYKSSNSKKLKKFLKSNGFSFDEGGEHTLATNENGVILVIPRHKTISSGVTQKICKKLVEIGFDKDEVERALN